MTWREETIGDCRLILGDCRDVLPTLDGVEVVVTDPPYSAGRQEREFAATGNIAVALHEASKLCKTMAVFGTSSGRGIEFVRSAIHALPHCRVLVWRRRFVNSPAAGPWRWDVVLIHVFGRGAFGRPDASSLIETDGTRSLCKEFEHPAVVPTEVMDWIISPLDGRVCDPFMGSGTAGVSCALLGRSFVGIEADPKHFATACRRIERAYGQQRLNLRGAA